METREQVTNAIADYIKAQSKKLGDKTNMKLSIYYHNWGTYIKGKFIWNRTEIECGDKSYKFTDKEITEERFVYMLQDALGKSGVKGKVFSHTSGDGCWTEKITYFDRIEIFGKPCKEFNELNKLLKKLNVKEINQFDIYSVCVCGKRSSYSDSGKYYYLCYNQKKCQSVIDYIKANKGRNGIVKVNIESFLDKGDEYDYEIAQYQESEWYGSRGYKLVIDIVGGKGKKNYHQEF